MEPGNFDNLYRDTVLDHCRNPRNKDKLVGPHITGRAINPFCGDEVDIQIVLDGERVAQIGMQSLGCAVNQAATSMLSEVVSDKSLEEIDILARLFESMMNGSEVSQQDLCKLDDFHSFSTVREYPIRRKCALLAWSALREAIEAYRGTHSP